VLACACDREPRAFRGFGPAPLVQPDERHAAQTIDLGARAGADPRSRPLEVAPAEVAERRVGEQEGQRRTAVRAVPRIQGLFERAIAS
jgi:hypothetical protein